MNISDFREDDDEALVIQEQPKTEIYWGMHGHLVLKQFHDSCCPLSEDEREPMQIFNPLVLPELIHCLQGKWRAYCEAHDLPLVQDALASLPPLPTPTSSPKKRGPP